MLTKWRVLFGLHDFQKCQLVNISVKRNIKLEIICKNSDFCFLEIAVAEIWQHMQAFPQSSTRKVKTVYAFLCRGCHPPVSIRPLYSLTFPALTLQALELAALLHSSIIVTYRTKIHTHTHTHTHTQTHTHTDTHTQTHTQTQTHRHTHTHTHTHTHMFSPPSGVVFDYENTKRAKH